MEDYDPVVHLQSGEDGGLMPCCGRTRFDVPVLDVMTVSRALVTCRVRSPTPLSVTCKGFCYVDQSRAICDECGRPAGEHEGVTDASPMTI